MAQSGALHVRVYTSQAEIPVVGAAVIVASRGTDGKYQLISLQETDDSGNIKPVRVDAPPAAESTSPEQMEQPFAVVDVWVEQRRSFLNFTTLSLLTSSSAFRT